MTAGKANEVPTETYRRWGGGHGLGSALFWDFCKDKTIKDGRNPANVVCVCTSPLYGTIAPSAGGRCDVVGVGVGQHPQSLVHAVGLRRPLLDDAEVRRLGRHRHHGQGRQADVGRHRATTGDVPRRGRPVGQGHVGDPAGDLGADRATPAGRRRRRRGRSGEGPRRHATTQPPAVLCIGPAGENQTAHGCLVHDAGNGAGQGGFGAVWGSKNLKAISVIGTGAISVADPQALLKARFVAEGEVRHLVGAARLRPVVASRRPAEPADDDAAADRRAASAGVPVVHQRLPDARQRGLRQRVHVPGDRLVHLGGEPRGEEPGAARRSEHEGRRRGAAVRPELVRVPDRPALARTAPRRARDRRRGEGAVEPAVGEARHAGVRREAHSRPVQPPGHRQGPGRRLGAGRREVGPHGRPRQRQHGLLLLGHARPRLRPARRAGVGLRQHPRQPGHQRALLQHHLHQRQRRVRVRQADAPRSRANSSNWSRAS